MEPCDPKTSVPKPPIRKLKVKTGCVTCRIRKVKCDEERPFCNRCRATGRTCDGYVSSHVASVAFSPAPRRKSPQQTSVAMRPLQPASTPSCLIFTDMMLSSILGTTEESQFLDFFHRDTGRALSGAFDTGFTHVLPQLSQSEPAIRHALLAVGSLHAQYESSNDLSQKDVILCRQFTLQQYNRAITSLKQRLSGDEEVTEITLMCCVLFICLECSRGNRVVALSHLQNGLNILYSASAKKKDNNIFGSDFLQKNLRHIFSRLDGQLTLFGKPASDFYPDSEETALPMVSHTFNTVFEAKTLMDTLVTSSLQFVQSTFKIRYTDAPTASMQIRQVELLAEFHPWQRSFEALMNNSKIWQSPSDQRVALLLRIHHKATLIWLSTSLTPNETIFDAYIEDFDSVVTWAWAFSKIPNTPFKFSLDMAIIAPLYFTAIKCRRSSIRRSAIRLLYATPGREGLWDARQHAIVAERVVAIEEVGLGETDSMPAESLRVYNTEILSDIDVDPSRIHVTFYTKPNGLDHGWVMWKEEIALP